MKKIKLEKKDKIYILIISLLLVATIVLSVAVVIANQRKTTWEMGDYYRNKVMSFAIQNTNLSKGQIIFVGDSITDLYPLDDYFADLDLACYNRGIGGDTTTGVINRLEVSLFDLEPSKIILMIGTNDINGSVSRDQIVTNYRKILDEIKINQPTVDLYFVSVIPQNKDLESYTGIKVDETNGAILEINDDIKKLCEEYGHTFVDLHSLLLDENGYLKKDYSDDGIHLNSSGFQVWTSLIKPYLEK
jgi:lysophospholipase L1-like esterase